MATNILECAGHSRARIFMLIGMAADVVIRVIQEMNRESDDSEDEELLSLYKAQLKCKKRKRAIRIRGYVYNIVPRYNTNQFREHFRLTPTTFENLLNKLAPMLSPNGNEGRPTISPHTQLLAVLWLLATPDSYR